MDIENAMRSFVAVVETGSFTAAAERLGRRDKTISEHVSALEERLSLTLLHRTTRSLSLTEAGRGYHAGCVALLGQLDTLESTVRARHENVSGRLRISAPVTYGEMRLVPLLPTFRRRYPSLEVELHMGDRVVDLAHDGFDLAIRLGQLEPSTLKARRLDTIPLWTVASPAYLERHGAPLTPDALRSHACLCNLHHRAGKAWSYLVDGRKCSVPVNGGTRVNSARAVRDLALAGEGIGLCPSYVVAEDVVAERLCRLLEPYEHLELEVNAVYLSTPRLAPASRAWLDFLIERLGP